MGESRGNGAGGMGVGVWEWVGVGGWVWSGRRDLNSRPLAPEASALPSCATPRRFGKRWEANYIRSRGGTGDLFCIGLHWFRPPRPAGGGLLGFALLGFRGDEFLGGVVVGELLDFLVGESDGHGGHQRVGSGSVAVRGDGFDEVFGVLSGDVRIDGLGADAGRAVAGDANGDFAVGDGHILRVNGDDDKSEKRGKADAEDEFHGWGFGVGWRIGSWEKTGWGIIAPGGDVNQIL